MILWDLLRRSRRSKKLFFSHLKCKHLHVGEECPFCPILEAHGQDILKSMQEKYLGDLIGDTIIGDGCNEKNITNRRNKGLGLVAQIMSMLETVSLGHYLFETAMQLRESIFINGILFNSEVWYSLNKKQIKVLEDVDKLLLRRVLQTPVSTPSEALYLETGAIPISFILKGRRIMYLYYLLQLEECEMLSQFFYAQWNNPCKDDWTTMIQKDLDDLQINLNIDEIKSYSWSRFKDLVQKHCDKAAFEHLSELKSTHSKMSNTKYEKLHMQPYLHDKSFHSGDARILFRFRTRMVRVRANYKAMYDNGDTLCPLCSTGEDTQEHLLACKMLHKEEAAARYQDIFGSDICVMKTTFEALKESLTDREKLLDNGS